MRSISNILFIVFLSIGLFSLTGEISSGADPEKETQCKKTDKGWAVDWQPDLVLKWADFQAAKKSGDGFALAAASCGFGYNYLEKFGKKEIEVFVRFYCEESWKHPTYQVDDVLAHEQRHFDICEIFGRKFYKGIIALNAKNKLNLKTLGLLYDDLQIKYEDYQDLYDDETDHSTNGKMQRYWNEKLDDELKALSDFANYSQLKY